MRIFFLICIGLFGSCLAISPNSEAYLPVSKQHQLYYATYGNPKGIPVVVLHGGPGGGCSDTMARNFDLDKWHVIMFDQRGAKKSIPLASMDENTSQLLVEDIEKLREHLGIEKWLVFGGSWGSTLSLLYGQEHPDRCLGFVLRGVFLAREQDFLHLIYGMGKVFPEAYQEFIDYLPVEERGDVLSAYYKRVMDPNPAVHMPAARAFMVFDAICATHLPSEENIQEVLTNDTLTLGIGRAFLYYAAHRFFLEHDQILQNMHKISHLPAIIVHGRWDAICLPEEAYTLHRNWEKSLLWMVPDGGHSSGDPTISKALSEATEYFLKEITTN